jgi:hypothetical protein
MQTNNYIITLTVFGVLASSLQGCATKSAMLPDADRVLSTTDGKNELPDWVYLRPISEKDGRVFVSGVVDISGEQSPSRGLTAADLQARANIAKQIRTRLSARLQFANQGFGYDNQVLEGIISQASDVSHMSGVRIAERGFAKILVRNGNGGQVRYTCYSLASVDAQDLKQMITRSIAEAEGNGKISKSFRQKIDREWNRFFDEQEPTSPDMTEVTPDQSTAVNPREGN